MNRSPSLPPLELQKFAGGYANLVNISQPTSTLPLSPMFQDGQGHGQGDSGVPESCEPNHTSISQDNRISP